MLDSITGVISGLVQYVVGTSGWTTFPGTTSLIIEVTDSAGARATKSFNLETKGITDNETRMTALTISRGVEKNSVRGWRLGQLNISDSTFTIFDLNNYYFTIFGVSTYKDWYYGKYGAGVMPDHLSIMVGDFDSPTSPNERLDKMLDVKILTDAGEKIIYFPAVPAGCNLHYWEFYVASDGSTYYSRTDHRCDFPNLSPEEALVSQHLARGASATPSTSSMRAKQLLGAEIIKITPATATLAPALAAPPAPPPPPPLLPPPSTTTSNAVTVLSPNGGECMAGIFPITWSSPLGSEVRFWDLGYSTDNSWYWYVQWLHSPSYRSYDWATWDKFIGTEGKIRVRACGDTYPACTDLGSDISDQVFTISATCPGGTPPATPINLTATPKIYSNGTQYISVRWADNSDNELGFAYYKRVKGTAQWDATTATKALGVDYQGLAVGTTYEFMVRAGNQYGYSLDSNIVSATFGATSTASIPGPANTANIADSLETLSKFIESLNKLVDSIRQLLEKFR